MIKDSHLREIVEKWGRREITSSMVAEAKMVVDTPTRTSNRMREYYAYLRSVGSRPDIRPTGYSPGVFGNLLGGMFGGGAQQSANPYQTCPRCGHTW